MAKKEGANKNVNWEDADGEWVTRSSILLYPEDKECLTKIRKEYGIKSDSAAIRFGLRMLADVGVQLNLRQLRNKQLIQNKNKSAHNQRRKWSEDPEVRGAGIK